MHTIRKTIVSQLRLDASGVPIYVQLRDQLTKLIAAGVLAPGAQMPTMREVAVALNIDLNTVRHAYDDLERAGTILLIRGRGSFVADHLPALDIPDHTDRLAEQAIALAKASGVDPRRLAERILSIANTKDT